jgi:RTX calcium-binding nonapeptide repeat (4 copies)
MKKTMGCLGAAAALTLGVMVAAPGTAGATPPATTTTSVSFDAETAGYKASNYATAAAPSVHFYDTAGSNLYLGDWDAAKSGNELGTATYDGSGLEVRLNGPTTAINMKFGYDYLDTTDLAELTLYRGATLVGTVDVNVNGNGAVDQSIEYHGGLFNRAVFRYVDAAGTPRNTYEVVDDVNVNPICTIAGDGGNNVLNGTDNADVICGGKGNDTINSLRGNDLVYPGPGTDLANGGRGDDTIVGSDGRDSVNGNPGDDDVRGGPGRDAVTGSSGSDHLSGGSDRDSCNGGSGHDYASSCEVKSRIP